MILGVIPARRGSKGIPGKNLKSLAGRPLIEYTFEAAEKASSLDRVWLSTDIAEAAELAKRFPRIETPFIRPPELCSDTAPMIAVLAHAVQWMRDHENETPEAVVLLQPTSPFRISCDIDAGVAEFRRTGADSLIGVAAPICHPGDCLYLNGECDEFQWVFRPTFVDRRQEYTEVHYVTGALYISKVEMILQRNQIFNERSKLFKLGELTALDIDTDREWTIAEALMKWRGTALK